MTGSAGITTIDGAIAEASLASGADIGTQGREKDDCGSKDLCTLTPASRHQTSSLKFARVLYRCHRWVVLIRSSINNTVGAQLFTIIFTPGERMDLLSSITTCVASSVLSLLLYHLRGTYFVTYVDSSSDVLIRASLRNALEIL